jgi:hypothetical protein
VTTQQSYDLYFRSNSKMRYAARGYSYLLNHFVSNEQKSTTPLSRKELGRRKTRALRYRNCDEGAIESVILIYATQRDGH